MWAWMLWLSNSLQHEDNCGLGLHALVTVNVIVIWLQDGRCYGLGMDALVTVLTWTWMFYGLGTDALVLQSRKHENGIIVCAWMLGLSYKR